MTRPPGQPLAEVVVGVTDQAQRHPAGHEGPEALAGRAGQADVDRAVGQPGALPLLGDLVAEHRADGAVDVADRQVDLDVAGVLDGRLGLADQLDVEGVLEAVVLADRLQHRLAVRVLGHGEDRADVEAGRLPVVDRRLRVERLDVADHLGHRAEAELGHQLADLLGDVLEERLDELRLAAEALAQLGVLGGDADRARVEVADAHHHAARHDERGGGEAELLGAEEGGDDDVAAGLQLAVGLDDDAVAQAVEQQRLLGLGQAELPRSAGVLERRQRAGAGAAVVAGDQHDVCFRLADPGRNGADPDLGDELDVHARRRVGVLEIVDQLLEILDRVDVVVRRRADQADARRGVPGPGDPRVHLVARAADRPRRAWRPGPS